jgi:hypothetical protein
VLLYNVLLILLESYLKPRSSETKIRETFCLGSGWCWRRKNGDPSFRMDHGILDSVHYQNVFHQNYVLQLQDNEQYVEYFLCHMLIVSNVFVFAARKLHIRWRILRVIDAKRSFGLLFPQVFSWPLVAPRGMHLGTDNGGSPTCPSHQVPVGEGGVWGGGGGRPKRCRESERKPKEKILRLGAQTTVGGVFKAS